MSATLHLPSSNTFQHLRSNWVRTALTFGAIAAVFYMALDATCALLYDGYSYRDQTISELSAIGAPTRTLWVVLGLVYTFLTLACGAAIWKAAQGRRAVQVMGVAVFLIGVMGLIGWPFAPMHQREVLAAGGDTFSDTMHLVLAGANSLIFFVVIGLGIATWGGRFRVYSIITLIAMLACGAYTGMQAPDVSANADTAWVGIAERVTVFGSMIWIGALGLLLRSEMQEVHDARS